MSGATEKRFDNLQRARENLERAGIAFEVRNGGSHLLVAHNGLRVEFTPGTGHWWLTEHNGYRGRGCRELIQFLTDRPEVSACGRWWYEGDALRLPGLYLIGPWRGNLYALSGVTAGGDLVTTPARVSAMCARWARAMNPLTGEVL